MSLITSPELFINMKSIPDPSSREYDAFFAEELRKIEYGVTINGVFIDPLLYWHACHWHIHIDIEDKINKVVKRKLSNPLLRDNEWKICEYRAKAIEEKKGLFLCGSRRLGKSEIEASIIGRSATIYQGSENVVSGGNTADIKLITDKLDKGLSNIHQYFRFSRIEDNWRSQVTLGIKEKAGRKYPWSYIMIRNYDDGQNTEAAAGITAKEFIIDEAAKFDFLRCLEAAVPAFTSPFGWRCSPLIVCTGGSFDKGADAEKVFNNPEAYNMLAVQVKDEPKKYGLFISGIHRMEAKDETTLGDYVQTLGKEIPSDSELFQVKFLASNEEKALEIINQEREKAKKAQDHDTLLKAIMYYPLNPEECFMTSGANYYNGELARTQKRRLLDNNVTGSCVWMKHDGEKIIHEFTDKKPISNFPCKPSEDKDAPVVIWEMPISSPPFGLYVAGCLLPGEKVLTNEGLKNVEEVDLNNNLINKDGQFVNITNLQTYYKEDSNVYTIKTANSIRTTTFTGEHPIYLQRQIVNKYKRFDKVDHEKFEFVKVENIKKGDWIKAPNIYYNESDFDLDSLWVDDTRIDFKNSSPLKDKDFWWMVGLFLGDGWTVTDKQGNIKIQFAINKTEYYYVKKLESLIFRLFRRKLYVRERSGAYECDFTSKALGHFLNNNFGKHACCKSIPEWAKRMNYEFKINLVLGYLDSDGCVVHEIKRNLYSLDFVSINLELIEHIQDIFFSIGIVSNANVLREEGTTKFKNRNTLSKTKKTYQLRVGNAGTIHFRKLFSNTVGKLSKINLSSCKNGKKPGKRCFLSNDNEYIFFQITNIVESKYTGWVYNFECDTHTYMCKNITTHNCDPYRQDNSEYSDSLGAVYIYKRMHDIQGEKMQDAFVAAYVARPKDKKKWSEQARLLIKYYNARVLCENDEVSFIDYMIAKGDGHYLEPQPLWLREIVPNSTVTREKGIHRSSERIREHLRSNFKQYMEEVVYTEKDDKGSVIKEVLGVNRIPDPMLCEEVSKWTPNTNVDRCVAAELAITMAKHLDPQIGKISNTDSDPRYKSYFEKNKNKPQLFKEVRTPIRDKTRIKRLFK